MIGRWVLIKETPFSFLVIDYDVADSAIMIAECALWVLAEEYIDVPKELQNEPIEVIKLWAAL